MGNSAQLTMRFVIRVNQRNERIQSQNFDSDFPRVSDPAQRFARHFKREGKKMGKKVTLM